MLYLHYVRFALYLGCSNGGLAAFPNPVRYFYAAVCFLALCFVSYSGCFVYELTI